MQKILGILGGMGPQATIDLQQRILDLTQAKTDQQHMRVLVDNHPQIPDRIAAVLADGVSPVPAMAESAHNLENCGAGCIVIPCVTAHYFLKPVQEQVSVPFLSMPEVAAQACADRYPGQKAGILCSVATAKSGLFSQALASRNIEYLLPQEQQQKYISQIILDVKAKADFDLLWQQLLPIIRDMQQRGAEYFVLACTELPLIARGRKEVPLVDATSELALAAIHYCGYESVK